MKKTLWKGLAVCTFLCTMLAIPSRAEICFLPTGSCEQGATAKEEKPRQCSEYVDNARYFSSAQSGMNCSLANIPGCPGIFECTASTCDASGYKLKGTSDEAEWPKNYTEEAWSCTSCKQGNTYFWKCSPKGCPEGYFTKKDANCPKGQQWVTRVEEAGKSGRGDCGVCDLRSCPEGTQLVTPDGEDYCYTCNLVEILDDDRSCYKCTKMSEYVTAASKEEQDNGCFTFKEKKAENGEKCYKPMPLVCPVDQYLEKTEAGCKCKDYIYEFTATPKEIEFTAAGGEKTVAVTSTRTGETTEVWEFTSPDKAADCTVARDGNALKVSCPTNPSTQDKLEAFEIVQTQESGIEHKIKITIKIAGDKCAQGQLTNVCTDSTCIAMENGMSSDAGQTCYDCKNNKCPEGYTEGVAPQSEGYASMKTESGKDCHMRTAEEDCSNGYAKEVTSCEIGYHLETETLSQGSVCGKCESNVCPVGKTCRSEPEKKCGKDCECTTLKVGDQTVYFDCVCNEEVKTCGDNFTYNPESCECEPNRCPDGYDERTTSCEEGYKLETKGKSGNLDCNKCVDEQIPSECSLWQACKDGTNCAPNQHIKCEKRKYGSNTAYCNCTCDLDASKCGEGREFDENRCACQDKECPTGYDTATTQCEPGFTLTTQGKSGDKVCGKCEQIACPAGKDCVDCPTNQNIACQQVRLGYDDKCYDCKCTLQNCPDGQELNAAECKCVDARCTDGYSTETTSCPDGFEIETKGKSGNKNCNKCVERKCPAGEVCKPTPCEPGLGTCIPNCETIKLGNTVWYYRCKCPANAERMCPSGVVDHNTCRCLDDTCPAGTYKQSERDGSSRLYEKCANGQGQLISRTDADSICYKCATEVCPAGTYLECGEKQIASTAGQSNLGHTCYICSDPEPDDTCPSGTVKKCGAGSTSEKAGTTEAGTQCYTCKDPQCSNGWVTKCGKNQETTDEKTLNNGVKCYICRDKVVDDTCRDGAKKSCPAGSVIVLAGKTEAGTQCYVCQDPVSPGPDIRPTGCTTTGNGKFYAQCCSDADCGSSSEFKLHCYNGQCTECASVDNCKSFCESGAKSANGTSDYCTRGECRAGECYKTSSTPLWGDKANGTSSSGGGTRSSDTSSSDSKTDDGLSRKSALESLVKLPGSSDSKTDDSSSSKGTPQSVIKKPDGHRREESLNLNAGPSPILSVIGSGLDMGTSSSSGSGTTSGTRNGSSSGSGTTSGTSSSSSSGSGTTSGTSNSSSSGSGTTSSTSNSSSSGSGSATITTSTGKTKVIGQQEDRFNDTSADSSAASSGKASAKTRISETNSLRRLQR